jgi:hypothetical protein
MWWGIIVLLAAVLLASAGPSDARGGHHRGGGHHGVRGHHGFRHPHVFVGVVPFGIAPFWSPNWPPYDDLLYGYPPVMIPYGQITRTCSYGRGYGKPLLSLNFRSPWEAQCGQQTADTDEVRMVHLQPCHRDSPVCGDPHDLERALFGPPKVVYPPL